MDTSHKQAVVAGGCFWGEKAWEAFIRPYQAFIEVTIRNTDTVYRRGTR